MSNFLKPINELPVVESISEGDKLLVNSSGVAKQIDASLVGGSGGGVTIIYAKAIDEAFNIAQAYKDAEYTQPMTYAEGKEAFSSGAIIHATIMGMEMMVTPSAAIDGGDTEKLYQIVSFTKYILSENLDPIIMIFSDSVLD